MWVMKNTILSCLVLLVHFISCKSNTASKEIISEFSPILCSPDPIPKYDGTNAQILDDNGNPIQDTLVNLVEKKREVFKPCRSMIYRAIWKDKSGNEITNSRIKIMASGTRWEFATESQDEIVYQLEFSEYDKIQTEKHQLNKALESRRWMDKGYEGIIENVEEIWMHPMRANQYSFTEVAPFPEVKLPLSVGKKWSGNLTIYDGWGDWSNTSGYMQYEVIKQQDLELVYGNLKDCWLIVSKATFPFGESELNFWFHPELGFVKKEYLNYGGQTLSIELEEVYEN